MEDIVLSHHFPVIVAEQWEVQAVLLGKRPVSEGIVNADADDLRVHLVQLRHAIPESAHFSSANSCESAWKEG